MNAPAPRISRRPTLPLVWIVPLVALTVGGWMIWREMRDRGPEITIEFADGNGIEPRKTTLDFQGVAVGVVTAVTLRDDLTGVRVTVRLNRHAAALARAGTRFWIVRPEIGLSGIRGLETLFTGARINAQPGSGEPAEHFTGLERPPPIENPAEGRAYVLRADRLGSVSPGAPVFYREVKVGTVETSRLADDAASVLIRIRISPPYTELVRVNSRFWNAGGVSFRLSLLGAELKSTSLESLLSGGVAFATPDTGRELAEAAPDGHEFTLHAEMDKDWQRWTPRIPLGPPPEAVPGAPAAADLAPLVEQPSGEPAH